MLKEFLIVLVELFFNENSKDDPTLKDIFIVIFKILLFLAVIAVILFILLNKH